MQGFTDFVFNKRQLEELKEALKLKGEIKIVRDYGYCQEIKLIRYDGKFKNKRERYI